MFSVFALLLDDILRSPLNSRGPAAERSVPSERHVGAVTDCFAGNVSRPISSIVPSPNRLFTYIFTYLLLTNHSVPAGYKVQIPIENAPTTQIPFRIYAKAQIPHDSSRHVSTRHDTFDVSSPCILAVSSLSNSTTRRARHVEGVASCRDVTSQVEFGLNNCAPNPDQHYVMSLVIRARTITSHGEKERERKNAAHY